MALFSGLRLTDRNLEVGIHTGVRRIVSRLVQNEVDEADCVRQLTDLFVRAMHAKARIDTKGLTRWQIWGDNDNCRAVDPDGEWVKFTDIARTTTSREGAER